MLGLVDWNQHHEDPVSFWIRSLTTDDGRPPEDPVIPIRAAHSRVTMNRHISIIRISGFTICYEQLRQSNYTKGHR